MLKIGEFSKLSHLSIKSLRYYDTVGLLKPEVIADDSRYRYYDSSQLIIAYKIKAYRQLGLSINQIKEILEGKEEKEVLNQKLADLERERNNLNICLSIITNLIKEDKMDYQVIVKDREEGIFFYGESVLKDYDELKTFIPNLGKRCKDLNPDLKCVNPDYCFVEYLDGEYKEKDIKLRYYQQVESFGQEDNLIKFQKLNKTKLLCVFHTGAYENIGEAYAYLFKYAKENNYQINGLARESYIDGIWNKDDVKDYLTEIELPIE